MWPGATRRLAGENNNSKKMRSWSRQVWQKKWGMLKEGKDEKRPFSRTKMRRLLSPAWTDERRENDARYLGVFALLSFCLGCPEYGLYLPFYGYVQAVLSYMYTDTCPEIVARGRCGCCKVVATLLRRRQTVLGTECFRHYRSRHCRECFPMKTNVPRY